METDVYVLDTNIIIPAIQPGHKHHSKVIAKIKELEGGFILLPVIAVSEIEYGFAKAEKEGPEEIKAAREFFKRFKMIAIDKDTIAPYVDIRAKLFKLYGTLAKKGKSHKEKQPEELRENGKALGIDERDLLIVSAAVQYNAKLITNDSQAGMKRIIEAARELEANGWEFCLRVEKVA